MKVYKLTNLFLSKEHNIIANDKDDFEELPINNTGSTLFDTPIMFIYIDIHGEPYKRKGFTYEQIDKGTLHSGDLNIIDECITSMGGIFDMLKRANNIKEIFIKHSTEIFEVDINPILTDRWLKKKLADECKENHEQDFINVWVPTTNIHRENTNN